MEHLAAAGFAGFKLSVVMTRHNIGQLEQLKALADHYGAQLRLTRLRPSGRGADTWHELHPTQGQHRQLYDWLAARGEQVLTGDSFLPPGPLRRAAARAGHVRGGQVVCLIDPVGDVYACPIMIHPQFRAGNVRQPGGFEQVWRDSPLFAELRQPTSGGACGSCQFYGSCRGGCMAAKFFTGLPRDGPDPECRARPRRDRVGDGRRRSRAAPGRRSPAPSRTARASASHHWRPPIRCQPGRAARPSVRCQPTHRPRPGASGDEHVLLRLQTTPPWGGAGAGRVMTS